MEATHSNLCSMGRTNFCNLQTRNVLLDPAGNNCAMASSRHRSCWLFSWLVLLLLHLQCSTFLSWPKAVRRATELRAAADERWWCVAGGVKSKLRQAFCSKMQTDDVPLLADFDTYATSLPVREVDCGVPIKLFEMPFYVTDRGMNEFAERISSRAAVIRSRVAYVAAAGGSGKSSSVLPGFLQSIDMWTGLNFTHYVYMPFHNNDGNNHRKVTVPADSGKDFRRDLGAAYMRDCFRAQARCFGQTLVGSPIVPYSMFHLSCKTCTQACRLVGLCYGKFDQAFRALICQAPFDQAFGSPSSYGRCVMCEIWSGIWNTRRTWQRDLHTNLGASSQVKQVPLVAEILAREAWHFSTNSRPAG